MYSSSLVSLGPFEVGPRRSRFLIFISKPRRPWVLAKSALAANDVVLLDLLGELVRRFEWIVAARHRLFRSSLRPLGSAAVRLDPCSGFAGVVPP